MSIYYDPNHWFIKELSYHFNQNPTTTRELLAEVDCEKVPFPNKYDPRTATPEQEAKRIKNISISLKKNTPHPNSLKNLENNAFWTGKKMSIEMRQKMSATRTGMIRKPHTDEAKEKMRLAKSGKKRQPHSEETKAKMKQTWINKGIK